MKKFVKIISSTLMLSCIITTACNNKKESPPDGAGAGDGPVGPAQVLDYPVLTLAPRKTTLFVDFPATIQGQQNIEIRPKIDGYVENIYVDEGATVKKGQILFRISAPQYEQEVRNAQANIKIAEAEVDAAQMEVNKVRPLVEKDIISKYELESAEYTVKSKQAALAQGQAALANARTNLGYTSIMSPVNGVVGTIPYKIGSLVNSNTTLPLTTVSNIGNIYAYFSVNEKQALEFSKDVKAKTAQERLATLPPVTLILATGSEFPHKGRIETESGLIDTETGSVTVRATFPNPDALVRSGSSGTLRIPITIDSALLVPQKATYELQDKKFVLVVESTGTVRNAEIKIQPSGSGQFYVVHQGLRAGDKIVLEGVATLKQGAKIKVREVSTDSVYQQLVR